MIKMKVRFLESLAVPLNGQIFLCHDTKLLRYYCHPRIVSPTVYPTKDVTLFHHTMSTQTTTL